MALGPPLEGGSFPWFPLSDSVLHPGRPCGADSGSRFPQTLGHARACLAFCGPSFACGLRGRPEACTGPCSLRGDPLVRLSPSRESPHSLACRGPLSWCLSASCLLCGPAGLRPGLAAWTELQERPRNTFQVVPLCRCVLSSTRCLHLVQILVSISGGMGQSPVRTRAVLPQGFPESEAWW